MKTSELRGKNKEELSGMVLDLKKEQFNLRMQSSAGELEHKGRFREVRRTIARIKTLLGEEEKGIKARPKKETSATKPAAPKKAAAKKTKKG